MITKIKRAATRFDANKTECIVTSNRNSLNSYSISVMDIVISRNKKAVSPDNGSRHERGLKKFGRAIARPKVSFIRFVDFFESVFCFYPKLRDELVSEVVHHPARFFSGELASVKKHH